MKTILIVDDTPDYLALVAMQLVHAEYRVILRAADGGAVDDVKRRRPDVVLVGVGEANPRGAQLVRDLTGEPAAFRIPLIICAQGGPDRVAAVRGTPIIAKPLKLDQLLQALARALSANPDRPESRSRPSLEVA